MSKVPKTKHALIKFCKKVLNTDVDITLDDVFKTREVMHDLLHIQRLSPSSIKSLYDLDYSDFGMFLKKVVGVQLLSPRDAVNNYFHRIGKSVTEDKALYWKKCKFTFDPYAYQNIPGYDLLLQLGFFHPTNNPNGICRDHILSVDYGFRNNVDPSILSHPANCQFITNLDNIKKSNSSWINVDELLTRVQTENWEIVNAKASKLPKTQSHKDKIALTNSKYMNVTNGVSNLRILKDSIIPDGYYRGMTQKKKLVAPLGFEPRK